MCAAIQQWNDVKNSEWIASQELTVKENGSYRQVKRGDPVPVHLFEEFQLWALYSTRKIEPRAAIPPPVPPDVQPSVISTKTKAGKRAA